MGEINIANAERTALKAVGSDGLDALIEQCLLEEQVHPLRALRLRDCGTYIASRFRMFEEALAEHRQAKSTKKRAETHSRACRAGSNLEQAVIQMKGRMEREEQEELFFYIEDLIVPPYRFSEHISVHVRYRWRQTVEDAWTHGSITFFHDVDTRADYPVPAPKRKPSVANQERDRQDRLYREWEHLKSLGLQSVQEFFRAGGRAEEVPRSFQARADSYSRRLNNFSASFWSEPT